MLAKGDDVNIPLYIYIYESLRKRDGKREIRWREVCRGGRRRRREKEEVERLAQASPMKEDAAVKVKGENKKRERKAGKVAGLSIQVNHDDIARGSALSSMFASE